MTAKGNVTPEDIEAVERARSIKAEAEANWRQVILDLAARSSVREAAKVARISPDTITQWKKHN